MNHQIFLITTCILFSVTSSSNILCSNTYPYGNHTINVSMADGSVRQIKLYVPSSAKDNQLLPLLLFYHGCGTLDTIYGKMVDNPDYEAQLTNMTGEAENHNYLLAYPWGLDAACNGGPPQPLGWNAGGCCGGVKANDVDNARAFVHYLAANMCVDTKNLFLAGFSNGGMFANRIGCEASDLFKAVAAHSGNIVFGGDFTSCNITKPINYLAFCGSQDAICRLGLGFADTYREFQKAAVCSDEKLVSYESNTTLCQQFQQCQTNRKIQYCNINGMGHTWSGGDDVLRPPTQDAGNIPATKWIYQFFDSLLNQN